MFRLSSAKWIALHYYHDNWGVSFRNVRGRKGFNGARFENLVASHLLKFCHYFQDVFGLNAGLFYLRDLEKREVDFLLTWEETPWLIVECKLAPGGSLTALNYFADRLAIKQRFLVVQEEGVDHVDRATGVRALSANRFLTALV